MNRPTLACAPCTAPTAHLPDGVGCARSRDRHAVSPYRYYLLPPQIGTEGDPYFEGQRMYQLYLMNDKLAPVVRCSVLPVLFVELVGPHIRVSALASPEDACVVCEPLTPYLHLFNMLSSQRSHMRRVARVLRALKRSVVLLKEACRKLPQPPAAAAPARLGAAAAAGMPDERHLDLQLPYPLRPGSGFRDVVALVPGNSRLLYAATHVQSGRCGHDDYRTCVVACGPAAVVVRGRRMCCSQATAFSASTSSMILLLPHPQGGAGQVFFLERARGTRACSLGSGRPRPGAHRLAAAAVRPDHARHGVPQP